MKTMLIVNSWVALFIAILFGALGTILLKISHDMEKLKPFFLIIIFYLISFISLTFAMKYIDLSVVYAVWSGLGTVFVSAFGILYFHESISFKKTLYIGLIVIGAIGINLSEKIYFF